MCEPCHYLHCRYYQPCSLPVQFHHYPLWFAQTPNDSRERDVSGYPYSCRNLPSWFPPNHKQVRTYERFSACERDSLRGAETSRSRTKPVRTYAVFASRARRVPIWKWKLIIPEYHVSIRVGGTKCVNDTTQSRHRLPGSVSIRVGGTKCVNVGTYRGVGSVSPDRINPRWRN